MTNPHPRGSQQESEEPMTDEIASLRATIKRLKKINADCLASERMISDAYLRLRFILNAYDTPHAPTDAQIRECVERHAADLKARAESAEATIARLAMVVRAAGSIRRRQELLAGALRPDRFIHENNAICADYDALDAALSALTAEDRRRAGIEG